MQCQIENCPLEAQEREIRIHVGAGLFVLLRLCQFCAHLATTERILRGRVV